MSVNGLLCIDKPPGLTSRSVVDRVQEIVGTRRAGHAGTLDPLATGVLVVCLGVATRLVEYVQRLQKQYLATFLLGRESPTDDVDGPVKELPDPPVPTREQILAQLGKMIGTIEQQPPVYSAVKIHGKRAYELARAGRPIVPSVRKVIISHLELLEYEYPRAVLRVVCGGGTYVRAIGRDLAHHLGTAAVMAALVREKVGHFTVQSAVPFDRLTPENYREYLLPPLAAVTYLPRVCLDEKELEAVRHGRSIWRNPAESSLEMAAVDALGRLVSILTRRPDGGFQPVVNLPEY